MRREKKEKTDKRPKGYQLIRDVLTDTRIGKLVNKIVNIYSDIPNTNGCLDSINKENGCAA